MPSLPLLTCAAAASLLMGCASAPAVREAVNPQDRAQRSITNFTPALRCMDNLMFNAGVRDLTMVMDDMRDATQKVPVGARDMMTSAVSEMTRRSRAVRLSLIGGGGDGGNLLQSLQQAKEANVFSVLPEYTLRGSISQIDEDVHRTTSTQGLTRRLLGLRLGNDARFSVMGLDAAMLRTESMTLVPGVVSKNTTVLRRQETGASDGSATLRSGSAVFSFATTRSEGTSQAARNMVELAAIEVVGKLTRLPYWQCLGMRDDEPEVQRETEDWFLATGVGPGEAPLKRLKELQQAVLAPGDDKASLRAAQALARFEWTASAMQADRCAIDAELTPGYTSAYQRVCCHYLRNGCFVDPKALLTGLERIRHLPCYIVNGRYDVVCPPVAAWRLKQAWPEAELEIVPMAGHTSTEPAMANALRALMRRVTASVVSVQGTGL